MSFGPQELVAQTRKEKRIEKRDTRRARKDSLQSLPISSYFTLDLFTLIPTDTPRFNIGYIQKLNNKWSLGSSVGLSSVAPRYTYKEDYSLWEIRPQILYYLGKGNRFQHFLSIEMFFINHKETLLNQDLIPVNDQGGIIEAITFDRATYKRTKYGATFNYGEYLNLSKKLGLRTTIGAGVRFKDNVYSNLVNPRATNFDSFWITNLYTREGFKVGFELNFSMQLIYKLN